MAAERPSSKGEAWFCTTGLPSDIVVEVNDMSFHLHRFPLMSRSRKLYNLITEHETNPTRRRRSDAAEAEKEDDDDDEEEIGQELCHISLTEFPGGSETFEAAAKFCYGVKIELTSSNVAPLRCAGEFLEMTEEYSEENLISRTERFLTQSILRNVKESIRTLKSCETLMPLAETLGIPQRCIDSIAGRASSVHPSLFGWPVNDETGESRLNQIILSNGVENSIRGKNANRASGADSWFEDLALLSLPLYKRLISAMQERDLNSEIIESSLISYAKRSIPGLTRSSRKLSTASSVASDAEQRELLETIVAHLPPEKSSRSTNFISPTTTRFLFGLLRTAYILDASDACKAALERKIASQLELAKLDDLLIPSYSYLSETLYDVDCVRRILGYFLENLEERSTIGVEAEEEGNVGDRSPEINPLMLVGKLVDGYLSEIAADAQLKPEKFCDLALAVPEHARLFDDGLYRAIDVYLKAHPRLSEEEREKICGVMDYQKLTFEACTHAAQNERLPLRSVVQVLFFEQLQLRHAIAGSIYPADFAPPDPTRPSVSQQQQIQGEPVAEAGRAAAGEEGETLRTAIRENQVLRLDMDSMRSRLHELERECSTMKKTIEKIDKSGGGGGGGRSSKGSFTKRFGCKFKTQVCDSHEKTAVDATRKGR